MFGRQSIADVYCDNSMCDTELSALDLIVVQIANTPCSAYDFIQTPDENRNPLINLVSIRTVECHNRRKGFLRVF